MSDSFFATPAPTQAPPRPPPAAPTGGGGSFFATPAPTAPPATPVAPPTDTSFFTAPTPVPKPTPPTLGQRVGARVGSFFDTAINVPRQMAGGWLEETKQPPMQIFSDFEGALQRGLTGLFTTPGNIGQVLQGAYNDFAHPRLPQAATDELNLSENAGLGIGWLRRHDVALPAWAEHMRAAEEQALQKATAAMPAVFKPVTGLGVAGLNALRPENFNAVKNAAIDTLVQSATDPWMYLGPGELKFLAKYSGALWAMKQAARSKPGRWASGLFTPNSPLWHSMVRAGVTRILRPETIRKLMYMRWRAADDLILLDPQTQEKIATIDSLVQPLQTEKRQLIDRQWEIGQIPRAEYEKRTVQEDLPALARIVGTNQLHRGVGYHAASQTYIDAAGNQWELGPARTRTVQKKFRVADQYDALRQERRQIRDRRMEIEREIGRVHQLVPTTVRDILNRQSWLEGTDEVRQDMLDAGYKPPDAIKDAPVLNILKAWKPYYIPKQSVFNFGEEEENIANEILQLHEDEYRQPVAPFNRKQRKGEPTDPLLERLMDRMETGRRLVRYYGFRYDALNHLGINPQVRARLAAEARNITRKLPSVAEDAQLTAGLTARLEQINQELGAMDKRWQSYQLQSGEKTPESELTEVPQERLRWLITPEQSKRWEVGDEKIDTSKLGPEYAKAIKEWERSSFTGFNPKIWTHPLKSSARTVASLEKMLKAYDSSIAYAERGLAEAQKAQEAGIMRQTRRRVRALLNETSQLRRMAKQTGKSTKKIEGQLFAAADRIIAQPSVAAAMEEANRVLRGYGIPRATTEVQKASKFAVQEGTKLAAKVERETEDAARNVQITLDNMMEHVPDGVANAVEEHTYREHVNALKEQADVTKAQGRAGAILDRRLNQIRREREQVAAQLVRERERFNAAKLARERTEGWTDDAKMARAEALKMLMPKGSVDYLFTDAKRMTKFAPLRRMSDALRQAMFVWFLPHMKNISVMQILGPGGFKTWYEGLNVAHALSPEEYAAEAHDVLFNTGGATEMLRMPNAELDYFLKWAGGLFGERGASVGETVAGATDKMRAWAQEKLWAFDLDQRIALNRYLKRTSPELAADPFMRGQLIQDTLFDYDHSSPFAQLLRNVAGAPFPNWRLGIITRMMKGVAQYPGRAGLLARSVNNLNQQLFTPQGYNIVPNTPLEEATRAVTQPLKFAQGTVPLLRNVFEPPFQNVAEAFAPDAVKQAASQQVQSFLPWGSEIATFLPSKYPPVAPPAARLAASLIGGYTQKPGPSRYWQDIEQLLMRGMTVDEATRYMEKHGRQLRKYGGLP